jgi:hypothetical protein
MGYITGNFQTEKGMTYTIRKQDTITRNYGVFWGATLVEGGFRDRSTAEDTQEWYQTNCPDGPGEYREFAGWGLAP